MFKVQNIETGEVLTVYGLNNVTSTVIWFLVFKPNEYRKWTWVNSSDYEPYEGDNN